VSLKLNAMIVRLPN